MAGSEVIDSLAEADGSVDGERDAVGQGLAGRDQRRGLDPDHIALLITAVVGRDDSGVTPTSRAAHVELQRLPRLGVLCPADVLGPADRFAIHGSDGVAGPDAVRVCRAVYEDFDYLAGVVVELSK